MSDYCKNCGGDGYTIEEPRCPACGGTGKDTTNLERLRAKTRRREETIEEA